MHDTIANFKFYCPTRVTFEVGSTKTAGRRIADMGIKSVLLVSGSGSTRKSDGFAALSASLAASGIAYTIYDSVTADPSAEQVAEATKAIQSAGHAAVVAYGGGSPIDCAKSAALSAANNMPILEFSYGRAMPTIPALPIIAVPTTAGTGTEMSSAAVTTDRATGRKLGYFAESFFPQLAIIDPENHVTMPQHVTAATGMDALTHAVESYLSLAANPLADAINLHVVELIGKNLRPAHLNGNDIGARSGMAVASSTAGIAFSQTGLGMVHGFAHPVGARHGVTHGVANAIILPYMLAALARDAAARMCDLAVAFGACQSGTSAEKGARALVDAIVAMKKDLGMATSLSGVGIGPKDAAGILADALTYHARSKSPRAFTDAELGTLLDAAITGDMTAAAL